jgi:hypothetical protein
MQYISFSFGSSKALVATKVKVNMIKTLLEIYFGGYE